MPISFACPECAKRVKAPDRLAGKRARCPACNQVVTIPEAADDLGYEVVDDSPAPEPMAPPVKSTQTAWQSVRGVDAASPTGTRKRSRPDSATELPEDSPPTTKRDRLYWLLVLALIPLGLSVFGGEDDVDQRIADTREHNQEVLSRFEAAKKGSRGDVFNLLPGSRIEGAHLPRNTWQHWFYAGLSAAGFFAVLLSFSRMRSASPISLTLVGLFTGTIGILLLLGVQWAALLSQGVWVSGRGAIMLVFYFIKFIGFSYVSALDSQNGFLLSFFGFTCGVGFCEELCKALPLIVFLRGRSAIDWRGAWLWGLASGIGFGVSEGITYSSEYYNGIATGEIYVVRFVSCVALHAIWSGSVGLLLYRHRIWIKGEMDWSDWFVPLLRCLGVAMILHGLYDTMLKRDMDVLALVVALASFGWMAWVVERTRSDELLEGSEALAGA